MKMRAILFLIIASAIWNSSCGPVPMPEGAYSNVEDLLGAVEKKRSEVKSFRITGRVDHFGERRIQGKIYLFAELPGKLRIELVSPFGNSLSVLTVNGDEFALHDLREGSFLYGPAEPCNIARLVNIPLPPSDVMAILLGHTPIVDGPREVSWHTEGYYVVEIQDELGKQRLEIGPDKKSLPLKKSVLSSKTGTIFHITYDRWSRVSEIAFPHEIRAKMPAHNTDLLLRYDLDGVEINVDLPTDAWNQSPPPGLVAEKVTCD